MNERVQLAISRTIAEIPGYFEKTLESRQPSSAIGSRFLEPISREDLEAADWWEVLEPLFPLLEGCTAFKAWIPGELGIVELEHLPSDFAVGLQDPKGTGFVSAVVGLPERNMPRVDFTVLILGFEKGSEVVFTFHPGLPIRPSSVSSDRAGEIISAGEALRLGLSYAKIA
jgi:hypothetical protein